MATAHCCVWFELSSQMGGFWQGPSLDWLVRARLVRGAVLASLGGDGEKLLLGFEEVSLEMSERISALLPPQGWSRLNPRELAHGRSTVTADAGVLLPPLSLSLCLSPSLSEI